MSGPPGWQIVDPDGNVIAAGLMPEMIAVAVSGDEPEPDTEDVDGGD